MKKTLKLFGVLLLGSAAALGFVACSSDDEPGNGKALTTAGVLDKESGLRLKKAGDYTIYYDEKGRVERVVDRYNDYFLFEYNPNTFSHVDSWGETRKDDAYKVGYNGSGYVSSMSYSYNGVDEDGYKESESADLSLSYSSDHISKISVSAKESFYEDGYHYAWTATHTITFTWSKNRLVKMTWKTTEKEAGKTWNYTEEWVYDYEDVYENLYQQYAPSLTYAMDNDMDIFAYVGLLGKGPDILPSSATYYEEETSSDGENYKDERKYNFRYGFNNNGSISYTYVNNNRYDFAYDYAETRAMAWGENQDKMADGKKLFQIFMPSHRNRK